MTRAEVINSGAYWDRRFAVDWELRQGPAQSRFFARLAVEKLPRWIFECIRRDRLTVCDWGCAQGDGTDVLAMHIDPSQLTGIDFSSTAIDQARQRYPAIQFRGTDWLAQEVEPSEDFDLVFSSNTLEHFHDPFRVLDVLARRARKGLLLALPYREEERIDEHFATFLADNIPLDLPSGLRLVWSQVVDCRSAPGSLWGGDQIFLVYADPGWVRSLNLTLSQGLIAAEDQDAQLARLSAELAAQAAEIGELQGSVAARAREVQDLVATVGERDAAITEVSEQLAAARQSSLVLEQQLSEVLKSQSWRLTAPLRGVRRWVGSWIRRRRSVKD